MARLQRDEQLEVEVADLAFGGLGVARHDGFVVFAPDTAPGERARVRVRRARRRWAEADLLEVVRPGPARVEAPCPYVPRCGGCRLQHVAYATALEAKRAQVREHLARIGHLPDVEVLPADAAVRAFGYRNKMEYSAAPGPDGGLVLGFHRRGRWDEVIDVRACLLATPRGDAVRETVRAWAEGAGAVPYDQRGQTGWLRHVMVREGIRTDQVLVTLVTAPGGEDRVATLAEPLRAAHPEVVGLLHAVNDGVAETTQGLPTRLVEGRDWFEEEVAGVRLRLSAPSFFQTNTEMTDRLYARVAEAAGLDGTQTVYDLYCGVGSIGIAMGASAHAVVAIDIVPEAVEDARRNAAENGLEAYRAVCGDVGRVVKELRDELPPCDVAIVDPPRGGLSGRAVRRVLELAPPLLVYVSCHPATLAENAARFVEGGYRLEWVRPVDMFPQTPHIEAVARFVRAGAP
ncbi:MAG TPA: 23S rRNA (uracil(1939)-C(5))-methyltransferase RlmD [Miltoncostaeaceae bacterium]|nr:23S rRNA (uracil(1939)-C(5))-methyltransferase RlmD [Miltoncostaeaceae bacterium]